MHLVPISKKGGREASAAWGSLSCHGDAHPYPRLILILDAKQEMSCEPHRASSPAAAVIHQASQCSGVHISPVTTGFGSDSKAGRDEQGQQVSQLWSAPRQNNTCLDISWAWRAIHLSSLSHIHSFTLSKYDLTLANTQRIYTHIIYPPFHKHCDTEDLFLTGNATISTCGLELHCDCF